MSHLNKTEFYITTGYRRNNGKEHCEPFTTTPPLMAMLIPSSSSGGSRNSTLGKQPSYWSFLEIQVREKILS